MVKLHFPSVAALRKSFFVLDLAQVCPRLVFLCLCLSFFSPSNVLVLPLFRPELALESAQDPLHILAMTFSTLKAFGKTIEGLQRGYL